MTGLEFIYSCRNPESYCDQLASHYISSSRLSCPHQSAQLPRCNQYTNPPNTHTSKNHHAHYLRSHRHWPRRLGGRPKHLAPCWLFSFWVAFKPALRHRCARLFCCSGLRHPDRQLRHSFLLLVLRHGRHHQSSELLQWPGIISYRLSFR